MSYESETVVTYVCGHTGNVVERCAVAYRKRYCDSCATELLPKPSDCLRLFLERHGDSLGPMLGPIGAVINQRQRQGFNGMLAWSGSEAMHEALNGFEPSRRVVPYINLFTEKGL